MTLSDWFALGVANEAIGVLLFVCLCWRDRNAWRGLTTRGAAMGLVILAMAFVWPLLALISIWMWAADEAKNSPAYVQEVAARRRP
jgi:hypothetical protein